MQNIIAANRKEVIRLLSCLLSMRLQIPNVTSKSGGERQVDKTVVCFGGADEGSQRVIQARAL